MSDEERFRLNLYEQSPRGRVVMAVKSTHPMDPDREMLMFGIEYDDDVTIGLNSEVCFLPKELRIDGAENKV